MTFGELKSSVIRLGFERELEDDDVLLPTLSRALYAMYADLGVTSTVKLPWPRRKMRLLASVIDHKPGAVETFTLDGMACSFTLSGEGSYTLSSGATERTYRFDSYMQPIRLFTAPGSVLTFKGDYAFSVFDLSVIESVRNNIVADIPLFAERNELNLGRKFPDFISLERAPTSASGEIIKGAYAEGSTLRMPDDFSGQVLITYRRSPAVPAGEVSEVLDIPTGAEELVPLITASYIWLDDDPEKAQYYMSLYLDGLRSYKRISHSGTCAPYITNGWA